MKRKRNNLSRVTFWGGCAIFVVSLVFLQLDSRSGFLTEKIKKSRTAVTQAEIKEKRLSAINKAIGNHENTYRFEVSGSSMLFMPYSTEEGIQTR